MPLTQADAVVLSLLLERNMHGYEVGQEYERQEVQDWASVSKAQVYYALKKLAAARLIEPVDPPSGPVDGRGKTVFSVTKDGRSALEDALAAPTWAETRVPQPFATWVGLSIDADPTVKAEMIVRRKAFLLAELKREQDSLRYVRTLDLPRAKVGEKTILLTISMIEAELDWIRTELA